MNDTTTATPYARALSVLTGTLDSRLDLGAPDGFGIERALYDAAVMLRVLLPIIPRSPAHLGQTLIAVDRLNVIAASAARVHVEGAADFGRALSAARVNLQRAAGRLPSGHPAR